MKSYKCPACGEKQLSVLQWQTVSIAFEFQFSSGESAEFNREGGEHEAWACPDCGEDLPAKLSEKISKQLFG